jgi:hypothetical protein
MDFVIPMNSTNPKKVYDVTEEEQLFLSTLVEKAQVNKLKNSFRYSRLSNGTINVDYGSYFIGKINVQGKNPYLMYMENLYDSKNIEGNLQDLTAGIDYWIKYIKKYLK